MDIRTAVVDALDDLCSSRSSLARRSRALNALERLLAELCTSQERQRLMLFLELQNGFECNVASRLLASLAMCLPAMQELISSTSQQEESSSDPTSLITHAQQSLSILQGIALIHPASKEFLGRKFSIHLLLDLLAIARHAPSTESLSASSSSISSSSSLTAGASSLASSVLDTLLCILVDSPAALRVFEESNGVENVVKTLKRAGLARDIRMKCLEFLYFYLLPEDGSPPPNLRSASTPGPFKMNSAVTSSLSRSVPSSPINPSFQIPRNENSKPKPKMEIQTGLTPSSSRAATPPTPSKTAAQFGMLQNDVDYVPLSPKKSQVARLGVGTPGKPRLPGSSGIATPGSQSQSSTRLLFPSFAPSTPSRKTQTPRSTIKRMDPTDVHSRVPTNVFEETTNRPRRDSSKSTRSVKRMDEESTSTPRSTVHVKGRIRSTEEKKELLGTWLGNVDALVEGVQKAGVWGLM
ncbi:hypothetical protein FRC02_004197 [Tulasnella sp. 418]|nr:hypothetical protein FRC02_004197 [Tulasnella sp. 418]